MQSNLAALFGAMALQYAAAALAAPPRENLQLPLRYEWDFETPSQNGADIFSEENVPILLNSRAVQPDWLQVFGSEASAEEPDLFPHKPLAQFSRAGAHTGRRCLRLPGSGDHFFIKLARRQPVLEEAAIELEGWVMMRNCAAGSLRLEMHFYEGRFEITEGTLYSEPLRDDREWSPDLKIRGMVPKRADSFDVRILVEGSYHDKNPLICIDTLSIDVLPACQLHWPGRASPLSSRGDPLTLEVESTGLNPGPYTVALSVERIWPQSDPIIWEGVRQRYVAEPRQPLRLLENLRPELDRADQPFLSGLYRVAVLVSGRDRKPAGKGETHFAWSAEPPAPGGAEATPVKFGWVFHMSDRTAAASIGRLKANPAGYPFRNLLLDLQAENFVRPRFGAPSDEPPLLPEKGSPFSWMCRVPWTRESAKACLEQIVASSGLVREWEISCSSPMSAEEQAALAKVQQEFPHLLFGSRAMPAGGGTGAGGGDPAPGPRFPPWAQFHIFEAGTDEPPPQPFSRNDWALVSPAGKLPLAERLAALERQVFRLRQLGFQRLLLEESWQLIDDFEAAAGFSNRAFLEWGSEMLVWHEMERWFLENSPAASYDLDPRAAALLFRGAQFSAPVEKVSLTSSTGAQNDAGSETLVIFSIASAADAAAAPALRLWTGKVAAARGLLGGKFPSRYSPEDGVLEVSPGIAPIFIDRFPAARFETARTLACRTTELSAGPGSRKLSYRLGNRFRKPVKVELKIVPPAGWGVKDAPEGRLLEAGKDWDWTADVVLPRPIPFLKDYPFTALLTIREPGDGADPDAGASFTYRMAHSVTLRSEAVDVRVNPVEAGSRFFPFTVRNISPGPVSLKVFSKAILGEGGEPVSTWNGILLSPQEEKELSLKLPQQLTAFSGKEFWVGVQVSGSGSYNTFTYKALTSSSGVEFKRQ